MGTDESYSIEETVVVDRLLYGVTFGRPAELRLKVFSSRHWAGPYTSKALAEANRPPTPPDPVSVE